MKSDAAPIQPCLTSRAVLVVDHNRTNLAVLTRRISEAGYRVTAAKCGANAIAELHRKPVDLVIAELYMPHDRRRRAHPRDPRAKRRGGTCR